MGRSEKLRDGLQALVAVDEVVTHAFVANGGEGRPSKTSFWVLGLTSRNVLLATASHLVRWKVQGHVQRLPREPFADLPDGRLPGFERWTFNGLSLWLDRSSRQEAADMNEMLGGPPTP
ncbi:hypothetical protein B7486_74215 [cyanobacterium TDX16]|nr:hypothetical protein B7486_74215 [cyanobacterium TDX16]